MRFAVALILCSLTLGTVGAEGKGEAGLIESFDVSGVSRLVLERGAIFDVDVTGYSGNSVKIEVYAVPGDTVTHAKQGSDLIVTYKGDINIRSIGSVRRHIVAKVPSRLALNLVTSTGDITVESVTGRKNLRTTTGRIAVRSSDGEIRAESTTGDMRFDYVTGDIQAQSTTGDIELARVTGQIDLKSTIGSHSGREVELTSDSTFKTTTGRIEMDLTNTIAELYFQLSSTTGLITLGETEVRGELVQSNGLLRVRGESTTGKQTYK